MIRKEIKQDGTFGGNYPDNIDYPDLPANLIEIDDEQAFAIDFNPDGFRYINGEIVDVSETDDYKAKVQAAENIIRKKQLQSEIDVLDIKRIRAIAEPQLKDADSGQTWLEYYTQQIVVLRAQIAGL